MADQAPTSPDQDAAASGPIDEATPHASRVEDRIETVRVRRAPKFSVFLVAGAALGIVAALILTFAFNGTGQESPNTGLIYTQGQVFGFVSLICITVGVALGAVVALIFDRASSKRSREVTVDHESVHLDD